jgi:hypothetical protein
MMPGVNCSSGAHDEYLYNPAAFTLTGFQIGTFGNAPRGDCRGAKLVNTDFALYKNWKVSMLGNERMRIQFRLEQRLQYALVPFYGQQHQRPDGGWTRYLRRAPERRRTT